MNYRINIEISPSSSSLDLTDIQDIQNPSEHADTDFDESEPEETFKYPPFSSSLSPKFIEFTKVFPQFPKTHSDGYATVIEIDESILNKKALLALKRGCQYSSLKDGHGFRLTKNIPFFTETDNPNGTMEHSWRRCAGVKACEFLPEEMRVSHTEVDADGLEWAKYLAEQELAEASTFDAKVETLYETYIDDLCSCFKPPNTCKGRTVIRSFEKNAKYMSTNRLFIGCEKWVKKETGHTCILLQHYDPIAVIQRWGKERVVIHDDIIESLGLRKWFDNSTITISGIFSSYISNCRISNTKVLCSICKHSRIQESTMSILLLCN